MQKQNLKFQGTQWLNDPRKLRTLIFDMLAQIQGKKILDARRKRAAQMVLFGITITLATLGAEVLGVLRSMENWFYDQRAYYFQYTMPRPTESLVHLDIDDGVLEAQNMKWPWPRRIQAAIIREMSRADPKVIFLDITYQEADQERPQEDAALAEAIAESGRVLAPVTLNLAIRQSSSELHRRLVTELKQNLKLGEVELLSKLGGLEAIGTTETQFRREFISARKEASRVEILLLLQRQPDIDLAGVLRSLLNQTENEISAISTVVQNQYTLLKRERAIARFMIPRSFEFDEVVTPNTISAPIVEVANAAASSGFVDYIPSYGGDSKVRFVPLFVEINGQVLPHVSLVMACRYWDIPLNEVTLKSDRVVVPNPRGAATEIPVRTLYREGTNNNAMFVADIPWFGDRRWENMYDVPAHKTSRQHHSLVLVTNILDTEKNIGINMNDCRRLLLQSLALLSPDVAEGFADLTFTVDQVGEFGEWVGTTVENFIKPVTAELESRSDRTEQESRNLADGLRMVEFATKYQNALNELVKERDHLREDLRKAIGGKVVLVGFTATGLVDLYPTSLHAVAPGVVAHGAMLNGILTNHFWGRAPAYYTYVLTLCLGVLTTLLVALGTPAKATLGAATAIFAYILVNGLVLFDRYNLVVGVAAPLTAMGLTWAGVTLFRFVAEIIERNRIQARFSSYVDPELVNYVVENPEEADFAGREKEATVVFTDLEGFTTLSERLGAGVVSILNDYVARMTPIIRSNRGFIDKFLGDGIMFEFNAVRPNPGHAADALNAVIAMQAEMGRINGMLTSKGLPNLRMRVGVNTGLMIVGDAGGGGAANFTVLGDNVNLAARLESANKAFGTLMMMTQATLDQTGGRFAVRPVARLVVKGKENAVMTYEPLGLASQITDEQKKLISLSQAIFDAYVAGEFEKCMAACDDMNAQVGETRYAELYHKQAQLLLAEGAGPDFDGTVTLSEK